MRTRKEGKKEERIRKENTLLQERIQWRYLIHWYGISITPNAHTLSTNTIIHAPFATVN